MKTTVEEITPEKARDMLAENTGNRTVRHGWIAELVDIIQRGDWVLTHQGIAITSDGRLLDGQHRLHAIVESGIGVRMNVSRDVDERAWTCIDIGKVRATSDRIRLLPDENDNVTACALIRKYQRFAVHKNNRARPISEVQATFDSMKQAFTIVSAAFRSKVRYLTRTDIGAALVVYINHDPVRGEQFLDAYLMGENLRRDSPILRLRETVLLTQYKSSASGGAYWRAIRATQYHHALETVSRQIQPATVDWAGNENTGVISARSARGHKAAKTKKLAAQATVA